MDEPRAPNPPDPALVAENVRIALAEDVGPGDITAALIPEAARARARVIAREPAVICGRPWFDEVFRQLDPAVAVRWAVAEGEEVAAEALVCTLEGPARALLTGERTALNFLQTLSGTATTARRYARRVAGRPVRVLDTRKTIPGLRVAQKYAVRVGGCHNHRMGLFDAFLIKENHIAACGGIAAAVARARELAPGRPVEVEVENLAEFEEALAAGADVIMLDDFTPEMVRQAVARKRGGVRIEVSGNLDEGSLEAVWVEGVDYLSSGSLTKHLRAIDFSMRVVADET
ncbi:MAG: nicotinate-nucleotide pyrophosphorylase [carboxylating] [Porticoccaceae bacterium]|nr:MAG: nicotinate-nucleotide pyrophosphorylase [carboxylating] [Porticoccaceae bacterium]